MLDLEAIKARLEEPGMGHLIEDACTLLEEVERLRAENERLRTALTGLATNCSAENIRLALQILGLPV